MRKLIISSFTLLALGIPQLALAQSNFDGAYLGLGLGRARGEDKGIEHKDGTEFGATQRTNPEGALFSIFAGANKVIGGKILLGAETDYEKRNYSHTSPQKINGGEVSDYPITTNVKDAKSLRARLGYVFNNDKTLAYVTGGYSTIKIKRTYGDINNSTGNGTSSTTATRHGGYTTGFGLEHFLTDRVSLRGEYRYTRYRAKTVDAAVVYGSGTTEKQRLCDQSIRVGVAYNF